LRVDSTRILVIENKTMRVNLTRMRKVRKKTTTEKQKVMHQPRMQMLKLHACVLNRHAVRHGNNASQSVDSTRIRVLVFLNSHSYLPAT
jgi:hypothetical protein